MIVDASAVLAILLLEDETPRFAKAIADALQVRMSAATYLEAAIVVDRRGDPVLRRRFDQLIAEAGITIEPFTAQQARIAREAYRDFGRASGHIANLNFGDCFSYALAKEKDEPLLFKGKDFIHTDIQAAVPRG